MSRVFWRSLRSRILLLVVLTLLFLAAAAISLFTFLRVRHAETLSLTERHLVSVASNLARNYADHRTADHSLRALEAGSPPPPAAPPARPPGRDRPPHPQPDLLKEITAETLQHEDGIEGGFYAAGADALVGYAFPTHEGPGAEKGMPERERPAIQSLAREAVAANATKTFRFEGPHDAVLFVAVPIHEQSVVGRTAEATEEVTGAAWLMERLPGIEGGQIRQVLFGSIGFGIAALMTALLAIFVTTEIRSGVNIVLQRLGSMEGGIPAAAHPRGGRPPLEEFDRVLHGIDSLALALQEKIENQRMLESEVRHKERLSALGQFAAGIAHELRNPLGTIRMRTQMWQRSSDPEAAKRSSVVILEEIDRLDTIISRLLYFARPIQLQLQAVPVDDLCAATASRWGEKEAASGVKISCKAASRCMVMADRGQLLQVLDNLMENAVHSACRNIGGSGLVTIMTARENGFVRIDIMDDGRGFTPAALRHAMDPFYTTKDSGTGLGLSISFEMVQAHEGELILGNREGGGLLLRFDCHCVVRSGTHQDRWMKRQDKMSEVLIVDDDHNFRETLRELLTDAGYQTSAATNAEDAITLLQTTTPDLTLCDWKMPGGGGEQFLKSLQSEGLLTTMPVIILTAHGTGPNAMQAMQLGAYDFITKPLDIDLALAAVARAIRHMELQREVDALRQQRFRDRSVEDMSAAEEGGKPQLIGASPAWIEIFKDIGRVAATDVGVLLLGESGTGKEVVARTIHENSARSHRPFIILNCAALPPELLESELFGHERGAFTGAIAQKRGKFEAADSGTIFLDEIGELPLSLQPKLLRVLQEHTFERVGGTASIHTDVRVIAATNRALEEDVEQKAFRADLFYRLNTFTVRLPPLRERQSDIQPLAEYFVARYAKRNQIASIGLAAGALMALQSYSFPGNVRELEHLIDRAAVRAGGRAITAEQIQEELTHAKDPAPGAFDVQAAAALPFHDAVAAWERHLIEHALKASDGNKSDAARRLGIHRRLLYEKLTQFSLP